MSQRLVFLLIVVSIIETSVQESERKFAPIPSDTYRASVVQYYPVVKETGNKTLQVNAKNYEKIIKLAGNYHMDIIVFPEFGLSGPPTDKKHIERLRVKMYQRNIPMDKPHKIVTKSNDTINVKRSKEALLLRKFYKDTAVRIPEPIKMIKLCGWDLADNYSEVLKNLSCAALEAATYVVINLYEIVDCEKGAILNGTCPPDNFYLYNTNIVFNREGYLIARYRKYNIHGEPWADQIEQPLETTFRTDFGVKFGVLIGLDLLKYGITLMYAHAFTPTNDIVLSTHPYDEMPFLNSKHDQGSFAFKENKNLIAAGFSRDGGSGIYVGQIGWLDAPVLNWTKNYLMYGDVPKMYIDACIRFSKIGVLNTEELTDIVTREVPPQEVYRPSVLMDFEKDMKKYISSNYVATKPLDLEQDWFKEKLCVGDVCCYFEVHMETEQEAIKKEPYYRYRALVFNGPYRFADGSWFRIETCAIIACAGDKEEDCGKDHRVIQKKNATTFSTIFITRQAIVNGSCYFGPLVSSKTDTGSPLRIHEDYTFIDNINVHRQFYRYPYTLFVFVLLEPASQIEIFGINGRRFDIPSPEPISSDSDISLWVWVGVTLGVIMILAICAFAIIYYGKKCTTLPPPSVERDYELLSDPSRRSEQERS